MARLEDIASEVGVSTYTVSRVLNGANKGLRRDAAERAAKIMQTAERLGYHVNNSARAMRTGKTNYIGLVRPFNYENAYFPSSLLNGISEELSRQKLYMQMMTLPHKDNLKRGEVPNYFRTRLVDGILINYIGEIQDEFRQIAKNSDLPKIYINRKRKYDCVYQDELSGGYMATDFLLKQKAERIIYLGPPKGNHYSISDRRKGYTNAMKNAGLEPDYFEMKYRDYHNPILSSDCAEKILGFYESFKPPDAFVVYTRRDAEFLYSILVHAGKFKSLQAVNIITFSAQYEWPGLPIKNLIQPEIKTGKLAVKALVKKIKCGGNQQLPSVIVPYQPKMFYSPFFQLGRTGNYKY